MALNLTGKDGRSMANEAFKQLEIFQGLTPEQCILLHPVFLHCDFCTDAMIFEQGEPADHLYIVVQGEVVVRFKPDDGPPITVAHVQPGGVVGWSAALRSRKYTSSAFATAETQLLRVRGDDLRSLCDNYPVIGKILLDRLADRISERIRNTHPQILALLELGLKNPTLNQEVNHGAAG